MANSANDVLKMVKEHEIEWIDLRFTDPKGKWQHLTMVAKVIGEDELTDGLTNPESVAVGVAKLAAGRLRGKRITASRTPASSAIRKVVGNLRRPACSRRRERYGAAAFRSRPRASAVGG